MFRHLYKAIIKLNLHNNTVMNPFQIISLQFAYDSEVTRRITD